MKATVLIDNIGNDLCKGEWGLSIHICHNNKKILLDTGSSFLFSKNAERLGIDLKDIDYGVLSHAHYDHSDRMDTFFEKNGSSKFYLQKTAKQKCYGGRFIFLRYIGIKKGMLEKYDNRIEYIDSLHTLCNNAYLLPHSESSPFTAKKSSILRIKKGKKIESDDFRHEQSLVIRTEKGLVVFNSCSHTGVDNIINEVAESFPGEKIYAYIGGFHLYKSSDSDVKALAKRIKELNIQEIYTGHCTGNKAFEILKCELGSTVQQLHVGLIIEI